LALWKAAQNKDKWWYVAMLVINTVGILEIVYYFYFSKRKSLDK
jgi:methionyl-tRNA synthetase